LPWKSRPSSTSGTSSSRCSPYFWLHDLWVQARQVEPIPYSEFQTLLKEHKVKQIAVHQNYIHGELKSALPAAA